MDKEKAKQILIKYKEKTDLFNWCDEYDKFVNDNVHCLVNEEAEYMLKKSYEDDESPLSYDDLDLNDYETLKETLIYEIENNYKEEEEQKDLREQINLISNGQLSYLNIEDKENFKDYINDLDDNDLSLLNDEILNGDIPQKELFQWFIVSSHLAEHIKEHNGIILNCNWFGRECFGQSLTLDYMFIKIYIDILKNWFTEEEIKEIGYTK